MQRNNKQGKALKIEILNRLLMCDYYERFVNKAKTRAGYPGWSPNNIRRVVIASQGVFVEYHVTNGMNTVGGKKYAYVSFPSESMCNNRLDNKSILSVFSDYKVYSALEELVIVRDQSLDKIDMDIEYLCKDKNTIKDLGNRYRRLAYITYVDGLTFENCIKIICSDNLLDVEYTFYKSMVEKGLTNNVIAKSIHGESAFSNEPRLKKSVYKADGDTLEGYFKCAINTVLNKNTFIKEQKREYEESFKRRVRRELSYFNFVYRLHTEGYLDELFNLGNIKSSMIGYLGCMGYIYNTTDKFRYFVKGSSYSLESGSVTSEISGSLLKQSKCVEKVDELLGYDDLRYLSECIGLRGGKFLHQIVKSFFNQISTRYSNISDDREVIKKSLVGLEYLNVLVTNGVLVPFIGLLSNVSKVQIKEYDLTLKRISKEIFYIPNLQRTRVFAYNAGSKLFNSSVAENMGLAECFVHDLAMLLYVYSHVFLDSSKTRIAKYSFNKWVDVLNKLYIV